MGIVELTDVKEEDVNIEFFFKILNKRVLSKEAGQRSTSHNVKAVIQCPSSGLMSESVAQTSAGKSGLVRTTGERISTAFAPLASQTSVAVCHMIERGDTKSQSVHDLSDAESKNDGTFLENIACALTVFSPQIVFTSPWFVAIPGVFLKGVVNVITSCFMVKMAGAQKSSYLLPSADLLHPRIPKFNRHFCRLQRPRWLEVETRECLFEHFLTQEVKDPTSQRRRQNLWLFEDHLRSLVCPCWEESEVRRRE